MNMEINNNNKVVFFTIKTANYINSNKTNYIHFYNFFFMSFVFNWNYGTVFVIVCKHSLYNKLLKE